MIRKHSADMKKTNIIYQSQDSIFGRFIRSKETVQYSALITIKDAKTKPITIEIKFIPPPPVLIDLPLDHKIEAENLTAAYAKVIRFFRRFGLEMC